MLVIQLQQQEVQAQLLVFQQVQSQDQEAVEEEMILQVNNNLVV
jgi:hypothetical protein